MLSMERKEISGDSPRIGWLWGLMLVAVVVLISVAVPVAVLFRLTGDSTLSTTVMVAGALISWTAFIAIFRKGQRHSWWR